jgi:hypothetical protein
MPKYCEEADACQSGQTLFRCSESSQLLWWIVTPFERSNADQPIDSALNDLHKK